MRRTLSLWLLAFALLAAQTLGLVHRQVHADALQRTVAGKTAAAQPAQAQGASLLKKLFAGHDSPDCRLIDQLGHGDAMACAPAAFPAAALPLFLVFAFTDAVVAREAALFEARGPPSPV